jgi:hypothetical protein
VVVEKFEWKKEGKEEDTKNHKRKKVAEKMKEDKEEVHILLRMEEDNWRLKEGKTTKMVVVVWNNLEVVVWNNLEE